MAEGITLPVHCRHEGCFQKKLVWVALELRVPARPAEVLSKPCWCSHGDEASPPVFLDFSAADSSRALAVCLSGSEARERSVPVQCHITGHRQPSWGLTSQGVREACQDPLG